LSNRQNVINEAIEKYNQGHIITLMYHQVRPQDDEPGGWKESVQNEVTDQQWQDLLTPGTEVRAKWLEKIDNVAHFLKQLQDENNPVLWRPYHEMNGRWFWWGQKPNFKKLWIMMYDRYVNHHQLDNLLWVWNANAPRKVEPDNDMSYHLFFPGLEYVDVLASDLYHNDYSQHYHDELLDLAGEKVISIGECGTAPTPGILDDQPQLTWFMIWTKWLWTHNQREDIIELYNDPRVITLDEIGALW
jgi:mannan endo-1,4-beta-mannosidase